jgi:hypothetical protein
VLDGEAYADGLGVGFGATDAAGEHAASVITSAAVSQPALCAVAVALQRAPAGGPPDCQIPTGP